MKHFSIPILLALYLTLFGGWLISDLEASPNSYQTDTFSIDLPAGIGQTTYPRENGQTMTVFEEPNGARGFQVFTMPYAGPVTVEALKGELPDLAINDPSATSVDSTPALAFFSQDPDLGDTFEVWLVHEGLLYQVTTYGHLETWLSEILKTWRFS